MVEIDIFKMWIVADATGPPTVRDPPIRRDRGGRVCVRVREGGVRARSGFGTARGPVRRVVTFFWNFFFRARGRFGTSVLDLGSGPPRFWTSSVRAVGFEYNTRFGLLRVEESRASTRASARLACSPARPPRAARKRHGGVGVKRRELSSFE